MNYSVIRRVLGMVVKFAGIFMLLPMLVGLIYGENREAFIYFALAVVYLVVGQVISSMPMKEHSFYAKEGLVVVALSWLVLSLLGAIPFVITRDIPSFTDALFETVSGFTTTGSSILNRVEDLSHASLFWRSFTHWVGGMGVIVFILALLPMTGGYSMHLMRAESPGPSVGKLVPKIKETAMILYQIYFLMTVLEIIILIIAGMPVFDAFCIAFGSAGTGGFGVRSDSCASYSTLLQGIITVFIIMFGVNFNAYYFLLGKNKKEAFRMTEVRTYLGIIAFSIITIAINIRHLYPSIFRSFHEAAFQVGSIITTTGFATADFDLWPQYSRGLLVLLMFIGACAGSTGGGIKVSRVILLVKVCVKEIKQFLHPRSISNVKMDGKTVDKRTVSGVCVYLAVYVLIFAVSVMCITALEGSLDLETTFTSVACTFNNIGPGLSAVGPTRNFFMMSTPSKYILMFDMLAGRLELYPMLMIFVPSVWKKL